MIYLYLLLRIDIVSQSIDNFVFVTISPDLFSFFLSFVCSIRFAHNIFELTVSVASERMESYLFRSTIFKVLVSFIFKWQQRFENGT